MWNQGGYVFLYYLRFLLYPVFYGFAINFCFRIIDPTFYRPNRWLKWHLKLKNIFALMKLIWINFLTFSIWFLIWLKLNLLKNIKKLINHFFINFIHFRNKNSIASRIHNDLILIGSFPLFIQCIFQPFTTSIWYPHFTITQLDPYHYRKPVNKIVLKLLFFPNLIILNYLIVIKTYIRFQRVEVFPISLQKDFKLTFILSC